MYIGRNTLNKALNPLLILIIMGTLVSCQSSSPAPAASPTAAIIPTPEAIQPSGMINIGGQHRFLFGANYPWFNYGTDFGENAWGYSGVAAKRDAIEVDFATLSQAGINVVRWFVFADGRTAPEFAADGSVTGFDNAVFNDLDVALEIAANHGIQLILVLLDFHWLDQPKEDKGVLLGGHSDVIADANKRQTFLQNALLPLLQRYGNNPSILSWEIINEPEWAMDDPNIQTQDPLVRVSPETMQDFVSETSQVIHSNSSGQLVTVGSASRRWWSFWENKGLDLCQIHYYDWMEDNENSKLDFAYGEMNTALPCIIGEFPTADTKITLDDYYQIISKNKYAGAFPWSFRSDDTKSNLKKQLLIVQAWSQQLGEKTQLLTPIASGSPTVLPTETVTPAPAVAVSPTLSVSPTPITLDYHSDDSMYGFEIRDDEWVAQTYEDSQAIIAVRRVVSPAPIYAGQYALQLDLNLVPFDEHLSKGEAFVDVRPFPPRDDMITPFNLENSTITCWVYMPTDAYTVNDDPWIGVQLFAKDKEYHAEYGEWKRINPAKAGSWLPFILKPRRFPSPDGYKPEDFDPTIIVTIGVKIGVDDYYADNGVTYNGPVYIDACTWE